jgi:hypothetical protein
VINGEHEVDGTKANFGEFRERHVVEATEFEMV